MSVNVFEFKDYRLYLDEAIKLKRSDNPKLSFRLISKKIGYTSPNFILLVIQGKRNLSPDSIKKISQFLEHDNVQKEFFKNLVLLNQSETFEEKLEFSKKLLSSKSVSEKKHITQDLIDYYSSWVNIVIREMTLLSNFKDDPDWIQQKIMSDVSKKDVRDSLQTLVNLKLLETDGKKGLKASHQDIRAPDELRSEFVRAFHLEMILRASQALTNVDQDLRDITSVTIPVSLELLPVIKKKIAEFRHSITEAVKDSAGSTDIYQMNIQLFPLTKTEVK